MTSQQDEIANGVNGLECASDGKAGRESRLIWDARVERELNRCGSGSKGTKKRDVSSDHQKNTKVNSGEH